MKRSAMLFGLFLFSLATTRVVNAASDPLSGSWAITSSGNALLATSTGSCSANGTVPAAIYDVRATFGKGTITILNLGISIGGTNCTSVNFQGTGSYTLVEQGKGDYEASGTLSSSFVGRGSACSATSLSNLTFTAIGKVAENAMTITFNGLDSGTYAEGSAAGPPTCTATILNLTASGTGKKF